MSAVATLAIATTLPNYASAFWPFSTNVSAAQTAVLPFSFGSDTFVQAATNIDPNPHKGLGDTLMTSGGVALLAYAGPGGTVADVAGSAQSDRISIYVVRPGDTLSDIASMFDVSINTIIWANDLKSSTDVHPGDTLVILPISGIKRTVVKGDTLKSIAKKYNADATEIAQFNGLDADAPLTVGTEIIIPGGELVTAVSSSGSSATSKKVIYEPYIGGSGPIYSGYYNNPVPSAILTQGLHGRNAVDLGAARGSPIYAAAAGTVIIARNNGAWNGGYGNYVVISHDNGSQTLYAHMTRAAVTAGTQVAKGQLIGYVGSTGLSTGSHLHFEVRGAANPLKNCRVGGTCVAQ